MKKITLILCAFICSFSACQHEPIIVDSEYFNEETADKISEFTNNELPSNHDVFSIYLYKDSMNKNLINWAAHINYNHTLDAIKVDDRDWFKLTGHYTSGNATTTSQSMDYEQIIPFQIRSKTPKMK